MTQVGQSLRHKKTVIAEWLGSGSINIFGRPFAGKDTQSTLLAHWLGASVIGGGEILRSKQEAAHLQEMLAGGYLPPQDEYLSIITPYFSRPEYKGKPLVLSSVGRWHGEEPKIIEAAAQAGHPLRAVVYIEISPAEAVQRLEAAQATRDRDDDKHHVLENRMQEFQNKTQPVIQFYKDAGLLITVHGRFKPEDVEIDIINALFAFASKP